MLKVSDLRLKYPSGQRKIFDHLNITIQDKEKVTFTRSFWLR